MTCAVCGKEYREGKICPRFPNNEAVCIECCKNCRFQRNPQHFNRGCGFYEATENAWLKLPKEIAALQNKIRNKEEQAKNFYIKNKPWIAEKVENEVRYYRGLVAKMEEEYERCKKARYEDSKSETTKETA